MKRVAANGEITELLRCWRDGEDAALDRAIHCLIDELRKLARLCLRRMGGACQLETMDLVNELYLKLAKRSETWVHDGGAQFDDRRQFLYYAGRIMRNILAEYARARLSQKRGGGAPHEALDEKVMLSEGASLDLSSMIALNQSLTRLAEMNPRQSRIIELQFYLGLTNEEAARALGVSAMTVKRERKSATCWLYRELDRHDVSTPALENPFEAGGPYETGKLEAGQASA